MSADGLAEWLLEQIAADEHRLDLPDAYVVRNSSGDVSARGEGWVSRGDCPVCGAYQYDGTEVVTEEAWWEHAEATHQRTRVLAECEAKRRIVEKVTASPLGRDRTAPDGLTPWGRMMLRLLALPYADREGWCEEWRV